MGIILNPQTSKDIERLTKQLPQSILLIASEEQGAIEVAQEIANSAGATFTILLPEKNEKIDLTSGTIGVKQIRDLYDSSRSRRTKKHITIISYGERMTHQAQNAFLKLLEEPNDNTHFIIIASSTQQLLDTVLSRVSKLVVRPITKEQTDELITQLAPNDTKKQIQLRYIASGMPAELIKLAKNDDYFKERSASVRRAMDLLRGEGYDKIKIIHTVKDDRASAIRLVNDVIAILKQLIFESPDRDLIIKLDTAGEALSTLEQNGNIRLVLARAFL